VAEIKGAQYWRYQFISLCDPKQLSEYMIIEVEQATIKLDHLRLRIECTLFGKLQSWA
jgi:hypothetical protein